jgi:outer membrane biosynthesis protein TonB
VEPTPVGDVELPPPIPEPPQEPAPEPEIQEPEPEPEPTAQEPAPVPEQVLEEDTIYIQSKKPGLHFYMNLDSSIINSIGVPSPTVTTQTPVPEEAFTDVAAANYIVSQIENRYA